MAGLLDTVIADQVTFLRQHGVNIHFVNPDNPGDSTQGFVGHEICYSANHQQMNSDRWINGYVSQSASGSGTTSPGAASFHPNVAGQAEFARLVNECLRGQDTC